MEPLSAVAAGVRDVTQRERRNALDRVVLEDEVGVDPLAPYTGRALESRGRL
ncbi:hypothetical protein [Streptomyces acidiscabies]|uniref:hypothetical protein n=1 Tax=Streptomyces acidiscabies TaxID=42234 RepID=UPI0038F7A608